MMIPCGIIEEGQRYKIEVLRKSSLQSRKRTAVLIWNMVCFKDKLGDSTGLEHA